MQRGATRALVLAPTRELAAQIAEHFKELARAPRLTCAAVYGGVGMGSPGARIPQGRRHDRRLPRPPPRPHARPLCGPLRTSSTSCSTRPTACSTWASFPTSRGCSQHSRRTARRLFFSATLPPTIVELASQLLRNPVKIDIDRKAGTRVTAFRTPCIRSRRTASRASCWSSSPGRLRAASSSSRGRSTAPTAWPISSTRTACACERIHGNRSQSQRTAALAGFKRASYKVLVATDIAARGIDVEALGIGGELRRSPPARGLHPPRRPHGTGPAHRGRLHAAGSRRGA